MPPSKLPEGALQHPQRTAGAFVTKKKFPFDSSPPLRFSSDYLHSVPPYPPRLFPFQNSYFGIDYEYPLNSRKTHLSSFLLAGFFSNRPDHSSQRKQGPKALEQHTPPFTKTQELLSTCRRVLMPPSGLERVPQRAYTPAQGPPRPVPCEIMASLPRENNPENLIAPDH